MNPKKLCILFYSLLFSWALFGQIQLPKLVSDGIVLQRDADVKIWGWASPNEKIVLNFLNKKYETKADNSGNWIIKLNKLKAGGPHTMEIKGKNTIYIKNILIGDVWVCSGQSNMELSMKRVEPLYEKEIAEANYPNIRYFHVPRKFNFNTPQKDLESGKWVAATQETILNFSAATYFFGLELYQKYNVPIGLINSALGGSPAEAWMSENALKAFPNHFAEAQKFKSDSLIQAIRKEDSKRKEEWYATIYKKDLGSQNSKNNWYKNDLNTDDWETMQVPGVWVDKPIGKVNGVVWFRKKINVPTSMTNQPAKLILGAIVDADSVYINEKFVGTTSYKYPPRRYDLPPNILKEGKNIITIRVINSSGKGGFVLDKNYELKTATERIDLRGKWKYKLGATMPPLASQTFIRWKPLGLYNSMISPLLNYKIKGVIWYQGESNVSRSEEYETLFPAMIQNWRDKWQQGDFPFLFVQLASFLEPQSQPVESDWAAMREAQTKALELPQTGMAVGIDIGEWNDIHPLNKKDVGKRLALAAQKIAYGEDLVFAGPTYESMQIKGKKIILTFDHIGSGLISKNGKPLTNFAIAGADKKFVWAEAKIKNNKVIVCHKSIPNPKFVRYAWADFPENINFYNKEGLPAVPFRTGGDF